MDVAVWLRGLGLEQYAPAFRANEIDGRTLPKLTAEDLKDLGVTLVGHRRLLLDAIAALGARAPVATEPTRSGDATAPRDAMIPVDAERRQLTVMFCDLVGSTRSPLGSTQRICARSLASITAPSPKLSPASMGSSRDIPHTLLPFLRMPERGTPGARSLGHLG